MTRKYSLRAIAFALLMMLFSTIPQDYRVLRGFFSDVASLVCIDALDEVQENSTNNGSSITIIEEELFHHDVELFELDQIVYIQRFKITNEYCKGISPGTNLPPPDRA